MTSSEKPHKDDKLWGAVAEALVAAYALLSAAGKLSSYRPFTDVDGKDIVIDLAGGFKDIYLQVKCALEINRNRRIAGTVRLHRDQLQSSPKFVYIFCLLDRRNMELTRMGGAVCHFLQTRLSNVVSKGNDPVQLRLPADRRRAMGRVRGHEGRVGS